MLQLLHLFLIFAKIGTFTLGGGYAMLPLIENEIVDKNSWISKDEFLDLVAVAQTSPGVFAVNISIFIGYKLKGFLGGLCAMLGAVFPSFVMIVLIATIFHNYQNNPIVNRIFKGVRPAVVALIAVPVFNLSKTAKLNSKTIFIAISVALLVWLCKLSPAYIILTLGMLSIILVHKRVLK